jgi:hypothetical protein
MYPNRGAGGEERCVLRIRERTTGCLEVIRIPVVSQHSGSGKRARIVTGERRCNALAVGRRLKFLKFLAGDAELAENSLIKGRPNLASPVDWDSYRTPILVSPALVAAGLALALKSQVYGDSAKVVRASARHARFR